MRFQFRLEGLLRVRRLLEGQARERLDQCMTRIQALEHRLDEAAQWSEQTTLTRTCQSLLPASELHFVELVLRQTREAIIQCELRKHAEQSVAAELRTAFLEARRASETLSTLRENALRQFQIEQSRRDQSALDEMFLGKLIYTRNITPHAMLPNSKIPKGNP